MCDMCENPKLTVADMRARMFAIIDSAGWMVQYVAGEDQSPSFAYTIGLTGKGHPELYVAAMAAEESAALLNQVAHSMIKGDAPDRIHTVAGRRFRAGPPTGQLPIYGALDVYGHHAVALELQQV